MLAVTASWATKAPTATRAPAVRHKRIANSLVNIFPTFLQVKADATVAGKRGWFKDAHGAENGDTFDFSPRNGEVFDFTKKIKDVPVFWLSADSCGSFQPHQAQRGSQRRGISRANTEARRST